MRDNILFGLPFDEERYNHAIEVACLVDDLLQMPGEPPSKSHFLLIFQTDSRSINREYAACQRHKIEVLSMAFSL